ncbi:MAG: MFS transporter [Rhodanobacter sp.]|nr:MAG: MFS transporter [Rhodanobacter sp.]
MRTRGESVTLSTTPQTSAVALRIGRYRWVICALLLFATTINYMDRKLIGLLKPLLQSGLGWSETDYGHIVMAFEGAYAIGLLFAGRIGDRIGTHRTFSFAIAFWSLAAMAHALTRSLSGFIAARFGLGLGESANFPVAIKTVAEWFPKSERALATGIFNAGATLGALVTPLLLPFIVAAYGWRGAFIGIGALGFVWLGFWLVLHATPQQSDRVSRAELDYITSEPEAPAPATRVRWVDLLRHRETWGFAIGKLLTDPIWWMYLFWLPDFLTRRFHIDLKGLGVPIAVVYLCAGAGSIAGGGISSWLIRRGMQANRARKLAMFVCALAVTPVWFVASVPNIWYAVAIISLAAAAHQGWSANLFTTVSDRFPQYMVSSVCGLGGMFGAIGGMLIAWVTAELLQLSGSYVPVFALAGGAYLVALAIFHLLAPTRAGTVVVAR